MVSGFLTSPCDHSRIFSGLASEMRMAENESGSLGFSKKLKMSRTGGTSDECVVTRRRENLGGWATGYRLQATGSVHSLRTAGVVVQRLESLPVACSL